jgi:hypothetical protein
MIPDPRLHKISIHGVHFVAMERFLVAAALAGLALAALPTPVYAEELPHFRVEVIVLTHTSGRSDGRLVPEIDDYTDLIDPLARVREAANSDDHEESADRDKDLIENDPEQALLLIEALSTLEQPQPDPADEFDGPVYPETFINLPELSQTMANAWRRLDDSGEFQARTWRAWYQPLSRARLSPLVRIHDDRIVKLDWLRLDALGLPVISPGRATMPAAVDHILPTADYRLDGSVRLRMRQFMHFELDLAWREPSSHDPAPGFSPLADEFLPQAGFYQHRLVQSRTIRPGRLEYFDSGWLGVLVLVEPWEPPEPPDTER